MKEINLEAKTAYLESFIVQRKENGKYEVKSIIKYDNGMSLTYVAPKCNIIPDYTGWFPSIKTIEMMETEPTNELWTVIAKED
jgi:hypothetical protein